MGKNNWSRMVSRVEFAAVLLGLLTVLSFVAPVQAQTDQPETEQTDTSAVTQDMQDENSQTPPQTEEAAQPKADPLYSTCKEFGAPLSIDRLEEIEAFSITGLRDGVEIFREVVGAYDAQHKRARSTRYPITTAADDLSQNGVASQTDEAQNATLFSEDRTAHFVSLRGRRMCLEDPDTGVAQCAIPISCLSGEAEFVLLNQSDIPFATAEKPKKSLDIPPKGFDWVRHAGGTVYLDLNDTKALASGRSPAPIVLQESGCVIGAGIPELDAAYAWTWLRGECNDVGPKGNLDIAYLSKDGTVGTFYIGKERGVAASGHELHWSFPKRPMRAVITCGARDRNIPQSGNEVGQADVVLEVPSPVEIVEPLVYTKVIGALRPKIAQICDPDDPQITTKVQVKKPAIEPITFRLTPDAVKPDLPSEQARFTLLRARDDLAFEQLKNSFGGFIRRQVELERQREVKNAVTVSKSLNNLANGFRDYPIETVVALADGMNTSIYWSMPSFSDGVFRVENQYSSRDPVSRFFQRNSSAAWSRFKEAVPNEWGKYTLTMICVVSPKSARKFQPKKWADVRVKLQSFSGRTAVLTCEAR